jgi:hypothetical protein
MAAPVPIEKIHRIESISFRVRRNPAALWQCYRESATYAVKRNATYAVKRKMGRERQRIRRQFTAATKCKFPARFAGSSKFARKTPGFPGKISWHDACGKAGMRRFFVIGAFAAATILAHLPAAQAEFFSLDGRFQCLASGAKVCGDAQIVVKPLPPPPVSRSATPEPVAALLIAAPAPTAAPATGQVTVALPPVDPLQVVAARIQARRPTNNDIAWLTQAAHNGDARAIELLAWCKLNAIGMARNPLAAYLLYGAASNAALPNARDNQRLIYERDLSSEQRQQVLNLANEGVTLARIVPSAR